LASVFKRVGYRPIVGDFGVSGNGDFGCEVGESDRDGRVGAVFVWGVEQRRKMAFVNAKREIVNFGESCIIGSREFSFWDKGRQLEVIIELVDDEFIYSSLAIWDRWKREMYIAIYTVR